MVERICMKGLVVGIIILLSATIVLPTSGIVVNKNIKLEGQQVVVKDTSTTITNVDVDWWLMFHHDLNNTGYSSSPTAPETSHLLWTYKTGMQVHSSPAIVNGKVYIGSDDEKFYCFNANNGSKIWKISIPGGTSVCSPCIVDGRVYMSTTYDYFYCWDADTGEEIWKYYKGYGSSRSPAVSDDKVYFVRWSNVYCLDTNNGSEIWCIDLGGGGAELNHVAVFEGKVYVPHYIPSSDFEGCIYCLDGETGETLWKNNTGGKHGAPAIYDGKVYASANGIKCLDADTGDEFWHYIGAWSHCSPAVAYDKVYYVSSDGKIICLDTDDGDEVWVYDIGSEYEHAFSSPAVADGKMYVALWSNGYLMCLNAYNGEFIWDYKVGVPEWQFSSPAIANGIVYIGGSTDYVYAFGGYETPPEDPDKPVGPTQGAINLKYNYGTYCYVSDGDKVQFRFDWNANGSHDISEWSDYVESPLSVCMKHAWNNSGTFVVKAQARDEHYAMSNWSEGLTIEIVENNPPSNPGDLEPENGAIDVDIDADLSWNCSDPDGDNLTYSVYFGTTNPPPKIVSNQSGTSYDPGTMSYEKTYYWKIVAYDIWGAATYGPVWSFITLSEPNDPPYMPGDPSPIDGSTGVNVDVDLGWVGGDPDDGDTVFYDIYLEADNPDPSVKVADDLVEPVFDPGMLEYGTVYYWKVDARDNHFAETMGPVWHFTTVENNPPGAPTIDGPSSGKPGQELTFTLNAVDPDGDDVRYYVDWGDETSDISNFYLSGYDVILSHIWSSIGTYEITAKAEDEFGLIGPEATFTVTIPRDKAVTNPILLRILGRFPLLQKLIQQLSF